jgi:hypothetical protein
MSSGMLMAGVLCCCGPPPDPSEECVTSGTQYKYFVTVTLAWAADFVPDAFGGHTEFGVLDIYGQRTDGGPGAICWYANTTASTMFYNGALGTSCSSSVGFSPSRAMTTSTGGGLPMTPAGTHNYRFWRAQSNECYHEQTPTTQTIKVDNTGGKTIRVNGTNLAPGFSRVISGLAYAGYGVRNQSGYGGGTTVEVYAGCA